MIGFIRCRLTGKPFFWLIAVLLACALSSSGSLDAQIGTSAGGADPVTVMNFYLQQGREFTAKGYYDAAIEAFTAANNAIPSTAGWTGLGEVHYALATAPVKRMTPFLSIRRRTHHLEAILSYEQALALDPKNKDFKRRLAEIHAARDKPEHLEAAEALYRELADASAEDADATIDLAVTLRKMGEIDEAQILLERVAEKHDDAIRAQFELSWLYASREKYDEAEEHYWKALDHFQKTDDSTSSMLNTTLMTFSRREQRSFNSATNKGEFLKNYWRQKDPTPLTATNERLQEHFARVRHALEYFKPPSEQRDFDDRGNIYIKYGKPDWRYIDIGNNYSYQNESWFYDWGNERLRQGVLFDFAKEEGYGYREIPDLTYIMSLGYREASIRKLYADRADVHERMYGFTARSRHLEAAIDNYREEKTRMHRNMPSEVFLYNTRARRLDLVADVGRFRGSNGRTRYELYYSIPIKDLKFDKRGDQRVAQLLRTVVVRDLNLTVLSMSDEQIEVSVHKDIDRDKHIFIGQVNLEWEPGQRLPLLNLEVKNERSRREALYYQHIDEQDFRGDSLMVSDIQYSFDIRPASGPPTAFVKNGLRVEPHPSMEMTPRSDTFVYFEIYNLTPDRNQRYHYQVKYTLEGGDTEGDAGPVFFDEWGNSHGLGIRRAETYLSLERMGDSESAETFEFTSLDLSQMQPGSYMFRVTVTDLSSGTSVHRTVPLILTDPS